MAVTTRARTANLAGLRRLAVARTFFAPTTIEQAVARFGFVQADPDPGAGAGAGSHAAPSGRRVSRRRSGTLLSHAAGRGGLLRQLRLPSEGRPGIDAPAIGDGQVVTTTAHAGGRAAGVRARARHGASSGGRCLLRPRDGDELLGRRVERHHPPAGRDALSRAAADCAARRRRQDLRRPRPAGREAGCGGAAGAGRRADRCRRGDLRAAAGAEPVMAGAAPAAGRAAVAIDPDAGARTSASAAVARACRGKRLVLGRTTKRPTAK